MPWSSHYSELCGSDHVLSVKRACHNHGPKLCRVPVLEARREAKELVMRCSEAPVNVVRQVKRPLSASARQQLPSEDALRQIVRRARKSSCPTEPRTIEHLDIVGEFRTTLDGLPFLRCDCTCEDGTRLLIFYTEDNLRDLATADMWLMDGTFKTVSRLFDQLYTVHGYMDPTTLLLVYRLMSRRTQLGYQRLLHELADTAAGMGLDLNPSTVVTDFELAAINAVRIEFPSSNVHGCFFHFGQTLWRRVQHEGLAGLYKDDVCDFGIKVRQLAAMAFLSPHDVREAYLQLKSMFPPEALNFLKWFEEMYVLGRPRRHVLSDGPPVVVRAVPTFPPPMWNVSSLVEEGQPRGNNSVEAWHRRWVTIVNGNHVSVYRMINAMKDEQQSAEDAREARVRGQPPPPKRKRQREYEQRLLSIVQTRDSIGTLEFLRGIAHNISV